MKKVLIFTLVFLAFSCTNTENYQKIYGEWECASWINKSTGRDKCNHNVYFKFSQENSYHSVLGSTRDSGDFKISEGMLYVTPKGKMEFAVQIQKLNTDTLVFFMNQAGSEEILTLTRKQ